MTGGLVVVALLAAGVAAFVVAPLLRRDAAEAERVAVAVSEEMELESRRSMLVAALRDLEDDRATGKLLERDYEELHGKLTVQAVEVLQRLDALRAQDAAAARPRAVPAPRTEPSAPQA